MLTVSVIIMIAYSITGSIMHFIDNIFLSRETTGTATPDKRQEELTQRSNQK